MDEWQASDITLSSSGYMPPLWDADEIVLTPLWDSDGVLFKYNEAHDALGRFASAGGGMAATIESGFEFEGGGGILPEMPPDGPIVYHGTSTSMLDSILKDGLVAERGKGANEFLIQNLDPHYAEDRPPSVYIAGSPINAELYAHYAAKATGSEAVVIPIRLTKAQAEAAVWDEHGGGGGEMRLQGISIPPSQIGTPRVGRAEIDKLTQTVMSEGVKNPRWFSPHVFDPKMKQPPIRLFGHPRPRGAQLVMGKAEADHVVFAVILVDPKPTKKYSPDQPRVPAGSSEGGQFTSGGGGGGGSAETGGGAAPKYGLIPGDVARFHALKDQWAQVNNGLLNHIDQPDSQEAQAAMQEMERISKEIQGLHADPGTAEGIGLPGGPRDVTIVGAGPGGLAASIFGGAEGLDTLIIEKNVEAGGQARYSSRIENFPGFPVGVTGETLTSNMFEQSARLGAENMLGVSVTGMTYDPETGLKTLTLSDGSTIDSRTVILAGGVEFRQPDFEGAEGPGVFVGDGKALAQESVGGEAVVVGGSNGAAQAALGAATSAEHVYLISRSPIEKGMSNYQVTALANQPKITVIENDGIAKLNRDAAGNPVSIVTKSGQTVNCKAVGVFAGSMPVTDWLAGSVDRDAVGRVATTRNLETNIPGVFAVGDMRVGAIGRIGVAVGEGQLALREAHVYLEDSKKQQAKLDAAIRHDDTTKAHRFNASDLLTRLFALDRVNPYFGTTLEDVKPVPGRGSVAKYNELHDERGRFASASGGAGGEEIPMADLSDSELATMHLRTEIYHLRGERGERDNLIALDSIEKEKALRVKEQAFVEHVAQTLDFPANRIQVSYEPKTFTLNGEQRHYGGSFNPQTGMITVWPQGYSSISEMQGTIAHEVMHARFDKFSADVSAEYEWVMDDASAADWGPNSPIDSQGAIKPGFEDKYPLYTAVYGSGGIWNGSLTWNLPVEDGVTSYSRDWWKAQSKDLDNPRLKTSAINETLAEIAYLEYTRPGATYNKPPYYSGTTSGSLMPPSAPSENWGELYNLVNSRWKADMGSRPWSGEKRIFL